jgi:CheY-like chemotaxis protein
MPLVRVLAIDDDPFILRMIGRMLVDFNCAVTTACSGPEGIDRLRQSSFDLVISDVAMPVSQGVKTIRAMRALQPSLPILAISGGGWLIAGSDLLDLAREIGATESLAKPFTTEQLRSAVSSCIPALGHGQ